MKSAHPETTDTLLPILAHPPEKKIDLHDDNRYILDNYLKIREKFRCNIHPSSQKSPNLSWKSHPSISQIYNKLPRVSSLVKYRRVQFAGHCFRADAEVISSLLLWRPSYGKSRRRKLSFPDVISRDTGFSTEDLRTAMRDRNVWSDIVQSMVATAVD